MGYIKASAKGLPSWRKGVWLGKTLMNDSHLVACQEGLFVTRSVRRLSTPWSLDDIGQEPLYLSKFCHLLFMQLKRFPRH